jgi:hypothetical protein
MWKLFAMTGSSIAGAPPIQTQIVDEKGIATVPWILFFNGQFIGDRGKNWSPNFVNLAQVGVPTITARYYLISRSLAYFRISITPGTNTTSTAGTTYIDNFPKVLNGDGTCIAVSGLLGSTPGMIEASSRRIYVPGWSSVTVPLSVVGLAEVQ